MWKVSGLWPKEKIRIESDNTCIIVLSKGRVRCRIVLIYHSLADQHYFPAPVFPIGIEVWLLHRYIQTTGPSSKLDFKRLEWFKILEKISNYTYKLGLPASMKCHPVFNVSLLERAATDPLRGQKRLQPPPIIVDDKQEWEAKEIVDFKIVNL